MKKFVCALLTVFLLGACALAESGDFRAGTEAAYLNGNLFFVVNEGAARALVRVDPSGKPMIASRADGLGPVVTQSGALYYLRKSDGAWAILKRGDVTQESVAYLFEPGVDVRALSAYGADLFLLVDGQLHIFYPEQSLCLKLADAKMGEYAIADDYAYFVSLTDIVTYELPTPSGASATGESGCLYKLNLSTGNTSLVMKAGAEDLKYFGGKLYFHNLADGYLSAAGDKTWVEGRLYSFDLSTETPARVLSDYDWDYCPTEQGLIVFQSGAVAITGADGASRTICAPGPRAEVFFADGYVLVYDPDAQTFAAYAIAAQ